MFRTFAPRLSLVAAAAVLALAACGDGGSGDVSTPAPPAGGGNGNPQQTARFTLALNTDKAVVLQGGTVAVTATITREAGFDEAVTVQLSGLPQGVTAAPVVIAAGATQAQVTLAAEAAAPHSLPTAANAEGKAGALTSSKGLTVTVRGLPGSMDTSFGGGAVITPVMDGEDIARGAAVQADGKVIVVGSASGNDGTRVAVLRYQRDGALDTTFATQGKATVRLSPAGGQGDDAAYAAAVQADGKIVVAGSSHQGATGLDFAVMRFNADGSADTTFGNNGRVTLDFAGGSDRARAVLLQADGKIVVGGQADLGSTTSGTDFALARLNANGTLDAGFGTGGKLTTAVKANAGTDVVYALAQQTVNGQTYIVAAGGEGDFQVVRYTMAGQVDTQFGTNGKVSGIFGTVIGGATAATVLPDGALVLAGQADHHFAAAQLTPAGQLDARFGAQHNGRFTHAVVPTNWNEVTAIVRQADGKLILGGWAYSGNSSSGDFAAVRLLADGTLDAEFATAGVLIKPLAAGTKSDQGNALVLQADDRVPAVRAIQAGVANGNNQDVALMRLWL